MKENVLDPFPDRNGSWAGGKEHPPQQSVTPGEMHASPSLLSGGPAAYELKLSLPLDVIPLVEAWAREHLLPDPHGDAGLYRTTTLYCDTSNLDVYRRTRGFARSKYRLRRYGDASEVFLERKTRRGDRVWKRRDEVAPCDLAYLNGVEPASDWAGAWFLDRVRLRDLRPTCRIAYTRRAFFSRQPGERLRLTLDRDLVGVPAHDWDVLSVQDGKLLLPDAVVLEMKFQEALPPLFHDLLALLPPDLGRVSKYRLCVRAWGLFQEDV